jgi:hypothetical protein
MKQLSTFLILICFQVTFCYAQPANDACSGAVTQTPDGTCVGGTTVSATDSWAGLVGCQNGNHNDVWYTFVATGTECSITVTNGTQTGTIEIFLLQATGPCSGFTLEGSLCGASPLTGVVSNTLTVGSTYYYSLSSSGTNGTFTTCVTTTTPPPSPGQDCPTADIICDPVNFSVGNIAPGAGTISGNASNENLSALGCLLSDERRSQWYKFTVGVTGTLQFLIDPTTNSNDYDWAIYNITTSGCALTPSGAAAGGATQVACNYSGCPGNTGIVAPGTECATTNYVSCANGPSCDAGDVAQFSSPPTLTAGQTYAMVIDNFSATVDGFNFTWGSGTANISPYPNFTTSLSADCMTVTVSRGTAYTGANMTYAWSFGDGFTSTAGVPGAHTYASTGSYTISLTITDALGCIKSFSALVNVGCIILPIELLNFDAKKDREVIKLNWSTASETNNAYFNNAAVYEALTTVQGQGNSTEINNYSAVDPHPFEGTTYYRLKQTDFNGISTYSEVKALEYYPADDLFFDIVPNPSSTSEETYLYFPKIPRNEIHIIIVDMLGRKAYSKTTISKNHNVIIEETLAPGAYMISVIGSESQVNKKMIIK